MIKEYKNFCNKEECELLISVARPYFMQAKTLGEQIDGYRVADHTWITEEQNPFVGEYRKRVSNITGLPVSNMERINLIRYRIGGEYKTHYDFFIPGETYYEDCMNKGGQRVKSVLLYLNDDFEGGETDFPESNKKVSPEIGKIVIWDNINEDGSLNYSTLHAGLPVTSGEKYIATIWIRENEFIS